MLYAVLFLVGVLIGAVCVFVVTMELRNRLKAQRREQETRAEKQADAAKTICEKEADLSERLADYQKRNAGFEAKVITYRQLQDENAILKRDLQNIDVQVRKLQLDRDIQQRQQTELDERCRELGNRYLNENVKWISSSITSNNFAASKRRLLEVIDRCRGIGLPVPQEEEEHLIADLKAGFELAVRAALEREEQARIKAQIREEQQREKEIERELKQLDREREAIKAALAKALAEAHDQHSEEVERLRARLKEAEERSLRAISMAQMTKSGHVYVISNIGSFGDGVFKVGMTRRLDPHDRVRELSSASVPFPYDVHMMISSNDAPKLENVLHYALHQSRVNKVNPRKEFFRSDIDFIRKIVEENHGEVTYLADVEALEYRQSQEMSEEDSQYIENVYDSAAEDKENAGDED